MTSTVLICEGLLRGWVLPWLCLTHLFQIWPIEAIFASVSSDHPDTSLQFKAVVTIPAPMSSVHTSQSFGLLSSARMPQEWSEPGLFQWQAFHSWLLVQWKLVGAPSLSRRLGTVFDTVATGYRSVTKKSPMLRLSGKAILAFTAIFNRLQSLVLSRYGHHKTFRGKRFTFF